MKLLTKSINLLFVFICLISCSTVDDHSLILKDVKTINIQNGQLTTTSILIENSFIKKIGEFHELSKNNSGKCEMMQLELVTNEE